MNFKTKAAGKSLVLPSIGILVTGLLFGSSATLQAQSPNLTSIKIDGSSTVFPISEAITKQFRQTLAGRVTQVSAVFSGTSGGFRKFCAGETDINDASRPINAKEMEACRKNGIPYIELPIAFDALTVVVNPQNTWAKDITIAELRRMWEPAAQGKIQTWNQVRATWPNRPLRLFGPGKDSGTFDYFTEAIVGKVDASRTDYTASEDDEVVARGVSQDPNALGFFGFAYFEENQSKLKALGIDNGKGAVLPARQTVVNSQYQPLARPLFIYVNAKAAQTKPGLRAFVEYYLKNAEQVSGTVGYIPLPADGYRLAQLHFIRGKVGTVFKGKAQIGLTIGELLRRRAAF
jgi:phosphate transport system substrate-binding protein